MLLTRFTCACLLLQEEARLACDAVSCKLITLGASFLITLLALAILETEACRANSACVTICAVVTDDFLCIGVAIQDPSLFHIEANHLLVTL